MANKDFTSLNDLLSYLAKETKATLQQRDTNVENVIIHEFIESIEDNVYDAYDSPAKNPYQRLKDHGGLTDRDNFDVNNTADGISIENVRKGVDGFGETTNVLEIIEGNLPYSTPDIWNYGYEEPRHAVEPAADNLRNSAVLKRAFELDLQNRGLKTE